MTARMKHPKRRPSVRDVTAREGSAVGRLPRRAFLRGAAGALVALPLLSSLRLRAQEVTFPKRLVLVYTPNGVPQNDWWPQGASETSWQLGSVLQPLAPYQSLINLFKGIDLKVGDVGPGGPHQKGLGGLWTGTSLQEGNFVDGCGSRAGYANGISVDQEVANAIGFDTMLPSLELGVRAIEADVRARMSYKAAGAPQPPMNAPHEVYTRLFSSFHSDPTELELLRAKRKSVLETVQAQFGALNGRLAYQDRVKLEAHLELVRDVERRLDIVPTDGSSCGAPAEPPFLDEDSEVDMPEIAPLQVDLLAMAFACDSTRVASLQLSSAINAIRMPFLDSMGEGHTLSHAGTSDMGSYEQRVRRYGWFAEQLRRLCDALAAIPEGDGTVLDNTLIAMCSDVSKGNTHTHTDMPFLTIGSAGGYFRTGRYLEYQQEPHNRLLVSILHAMGVEADGFGHPDYAFGGPLSNLT